MRYVELALAAIDLSGMTSVAVDETSYRRGHNYLMLVADAEQRKVVFVIEGKDAATTEQFAAHLRAHRAEPGQITSVSIDMSPAFIKGVSRTSAERPHYLRHIPRRRPGIDRP